MMGQLLLHKMLNWVCPNLSVRHVSEVPLSDLWGKGIRVLFVDLDNTLAETGSLQVNKTVKDWLNKAKDMGLQVVIVSNDTRRKRVSQIAQNLKVIGISSAWKPRRIVFRHYLRLKQCLPQQAAIIGDQLFTDILAGKRTGMFTILVAPLTQRRFLTGWIQRPIEVFALHLLRKLGKI